MADFAPSDAPSSKGVTVTERSGAAAGTDTVPAGCLLYIRNTGAAAHVVTLVTNQLEDGDLTVADRTITVSTANPSAVRVPLAYGDVNGRVGIGVDGTPTEVKYGIVGA